MSEFAHDILRALAEVGPTAVDLEALAAERWPALASGDRASQLDALANRGLVARRESGHATITASGLQYIARQPQSSAGSTPPTVARPTNGGAGSPQPVPARAPSAPQVAAVSAPPVAVVSAAPAPRSDVDVVARRIDRLRGELDALTQELSAATSIPMDAWSEALESTTQAERAVEHVMRVLGIGR
jgi:hypothetical protein